jgi:hypothetical protein
MAYTIKEFKRHSLPGLMQFTGDCYYKKVSRKSDALRIAAELDKTNMYILDVLRPNKSPYGTSTIIIRYTEGVVTGGTDK